MLPREIVQLIAEYDGGLLSVKKSKLCWWQLSANPSAVRMLRKNKHHINWNQLSENNAAVDLLMKNPAKICPRQIQLNTAIVPRPYAKKKYSYHELSLDPAIFSTVDPRVVEILLTI